jgi:S1-C subfamily serine protease
VAKPGISSGASTVTERKVSLGTIPDFSYNGKGYRLSGVAPGSPAEAAGLREGDVLVQLNDAAIGNIRDLSNLLKTLIPGNKAVLTYLRDGKSKQTELLLKER